MDRHSESRDLVKTHDEVYWVGAYANREYELCQAVTPNPEDSSFCNAMLVAKDQGGYLLILDDNVSYDNGGSSGPTTPFTFRRIQRHFETPAKLRTVN